MGPWACLQGREGLSQVQLVSCCGWAPVRASKLMRAFAERSRAAMPAQLATHHRRANCQVGNKHAIKYCSTQINGWGL